MMSDTCKDLVDIAASKIDLIKKGIAYNKASRCYKEAENIETFKLMKERAIEAFQQESSKKEDTYEKSLVLSYEALCWICLEKFDKGLELIDEIDEMRIEDKDFTPLKIVDFVRFLAKNEVESAEELWKDIHENFVTGIIELLEEAFIKVHPSGEPPSLISFKLSKTWNIEMCGKKNAVDNEWSLTFFDAFEVFNHKIILKSDFLDDLMGTLKTQDHYHFVRNIKSVKSSEGEDMSEKAINIVLATSSNKDLKFGFMMGHLKDGGIHIIAIWPEALARAIATDRDIFGAFITRLVKNPEWFSDVNLITFFSKEEDLSEETRSLNETDSGFYT